MGMVASVGVDNDDLIDKLVESAVITSVQAEKAFRLVDRGRFFPPDKRSAAYKDIAWKNDEGSPGRVHISAPCIYSNVLENLELKEGQTFLNIGSGTGYLNTLVGFFIGSKGRNHGIEIHHNIVDYARNLVVQTLRGPEVQCYDWAVPEFTVGNGLLLSPAHYCRYDRVYVGAAVPSSHKRILWELLKIGGILVMPHNDRLLQVRRKESSVFELKIISSVSFSDCILPSDEEVSKGQYSEAPLLQVQSLQFICSSFIRKLIRESISESYPIKIRDHISDLPKQAPEQEPIITTYRDDAPDEAAAALQGRLPFIRGIINEGDGPNDYSDDDDDDDDDDQGDEGDRGEGNFRRVVENFRRRRLEVMQQRARAFLADRTARRIARSWLHLRRRERQAALEDEEVDVVGNNDDAEEGGMSATSETGSEVDDDSDGIAEQVEEHGDVEAREKSSEPQEQDNSDESPSVSPLKKRLRFSGDNESTMEERRVEMIKSVDDVQCTNDEAGKMLNTDESSLSLNESKNEERINENSNNDGEKMDCSISSVIAHCIMETDVEGEMMHEDERVVNDNQEEKETSIVEFREESKNTSEASLNDKDSGCVMDEMKGEANEDCVHDSKDEMDVCTNSSPRCSENSTQKSDSATVDESTVHVMQSCETEDGQGAAAQETQLNKEESDEGVSSQDDASKKVPSLESSACSAQKSKSSKEQTEIRMLTPEDALGDNRTRRVEDEEGREPSFRNGIPVRPMLGFISEEEMAADEAERKRLHARAIQQRDINRFAAAFERRIDELPVGKVLVDYIKFLQ